MHGKTLLIGVMILITGMIPVYAQDGGGRHTVQPDETLYRIAQQYGISVDDLMRANGLTDADLVVAGTTLIIPAANPVPLSVVASSATGQHTVAVGENLSQIARRYGVTVDALIRANNLANPGLITVGQVLVIPASGTSTQGASDLGIVGVEVEFADPPAPADLGILPPGDASVAPPVSAPVQDAAPDPPAAQPESPTVSLAQDTPPAFPPAEPAPAEPAPAVEPEPEPDFPSAAEPASGTEIRPPTDVSQPDLGIIPPDAAAWMLQAGIFSTGDAGIVREIYLRGLALGNNPHAFSKVGDCNSELPFFLAKFDQGAYNLGPYAYLQPALDQFAGSFGRQSMAVWTGNHVWAVLDATWSNPAYCIAGETPLACEFRLNRPSLVLIRLGTNESGSPELFEANLRKIIAYSIEQGVIPVLGTKADRIEGSDRNNEIVRALALEYGVPLWDFGRVADTLPGRGLLADGFHMTYVPPDYTTPAALQTGHSVQNLMALMALNTVWRSAMY